MENTMAFIKKYLIPHPGTLLIVLLLTATMAIASPADLLTSGDSTQVIPYQGRLTDADGIALNGNYPMVFSLYDVSSGGTALWQEQWDNTNQVAVTDGVFSVMLGAHSPLPQSLFDNNNLWLGVKVDTDAEMLPRIQLGSVPYARTVPDGSIGTGKLADGAVTAAKLSSDINLGLPSGTIVMWSGSIGTIPAGWVLCDGTNGTPDLRDKFIVGAGNSYAVSETGGAESVTLTAAEMPAHSHTGNTNTAGGIEFSESSQHGGGIYYGNGTIYFSNNKSMGSHSHTLNISDAGGSQPHENRPPYFSIAFIMRTY